MPRVPRFVVPGLPHHITQRGNYRQPVFFNDADRQFFLRRLIKRAKQYEIEVMAWCLMINHFHLIAIPRRRDSFALGLRALLGEYSLRINAQRGDARGHIWQSRFYSCALSQRHLRMALRYVELNPVRANLVDDPEQYRWSSARCHLGLVPPLGVGHAPGLCAPHEWAAWLQAGALAGGGRATTRVHFFGTGVWHSTSQARPAQKRGTGPDFCSKPALSRFGAIIRLRPSFLRHNGSSWWKQLNGPPAGWS